MKKARLIDRVYKGYSTIEGAGVKLKRFFSQKEAALFDPFLQLDHFRSDAPHNYIRGFPWHPHRGIETVTYMFEGSINQSDSLGNMVSLSKGDVQWITSGSGIIHQEMPKGNSRKLVDGIQLWINLPAKEKMCSPGYTQVKMRDIPVVHVTSTNSVKVISGMLDSVKGPVVSKCIQPSFFDITLAAETEFVYPTPFEHTFFSLIISGEGAFGLQSGEAMLSEDTLGHFTDDNVLLFTKGDFISVTTGREPIRFILAGGTPLKDPIAWYGPIVMNNEEELQHAFEEFQLGTFMKHPEMI